MRNLNHHQLHFLYEILHHAKTSDEPIYRFLSGGACVGKTTLALALYQTMLKYLKKRPGVDHALPQILLLAPTGKAAYFLRGDTLHSAFKIPINKRLEYTSLDSNRLNTLRTQMAEVKFIFIDEISMVGSTLLHFIHKRLQDIFDSAKPFGGMSIIA